MSKVIGIFSKEEVTKLPFDADAAKQVLSYLLDYSKDKSPSPQENAIISYALLHILNNSGVSISEVSKEKTS